VAGRRLGAAIPATCPDAGRSNWYKGVQLITVYVTIALLFYFMPDVAR
jgi:Ca2+:H+ antiporter